MGPTETGISSPVRRIKGMNTVSVPGGRRFFKTLMCIAAWICVSVFTWALFNSQVDVKTDLRPDMDKASSIRHINEYVVRPSIKSGLNSTSAPTNDTHPPFYHKTYPVSCSAIFQNKANEIVRAKKLLVEEKRKSGKNEIEVPPDSAVADYSEDCSFYKRARDYPTVVQTDEEREFPLAFIILTHRNAAQVELLLRAIYQPHNVYAIHPDLKSSDEFHRAIRNLAKCFDNVFVCSKLERIQYAGYTRLLADINCMHDLVKHPIEWRYVINQCGEAFPIKTNLEMVQQIKAYHGLNDAEGYPSVGGKLGRYHVFSPKYHSVSSAEERIRRFPPPSNISLYSGNAYNTFKREFIEYVLTNELAIQYLAWINKTYSPDEHFWGTLQRVPGVPGGYRTITRKNINTLFVKWGGENSFHECIGKYVRGICIMSTGYLPFLAKYPHLFANKFFYSEDPITLQCLQELLTNRTHNPELRKQYFDEFPIKREWF